MLLYGLLPYLLKLFDRTKKSVDECKPEDRRVSTSPRRFWSLNLFLQGEKLEYYRSHLGEHETEKFLEKIGFDVSVSLDIWPYLPAHSDYKSFHPCSLTIGIIAILILLSPRIMINAARLPVRTFDLNRRHFSSERILKMQQEFSTTYVCSVGSCVTQQGIVAAGELVFYIQFGVI